MKIKREDIAISDLLRLKSILPVVCNVVQSGNPGVEFSVSFGWDTLAIVSVSEDGVFEFKFENNDTAKRLQIMLEDKFPNQVIGEVRWQLLFSMRDQWIYCKPGGYETSELAMQDVDDYMLKETSPIIISYKASGWKHSFVNAEEVHRVVLESGELKLINENLSGASFNFVNNEEG